MPVSDLPGNDNEPTQTAATPAPDGWSATRVAGLIAVVAMVVARSLPILLWPDAYFDADQAVMGLIAKHVAEGRAFPVFQYAMSYTLVIEAWLTAPVFLIFGASPALVKVVPIAFNVAAAVLLYVILTRHAIGAGVALVAVMPFALPGVVMSGELIDATGACGEQFFFALVLWLVRERPIALGAIAAIAVVTREFAIYAIAALVLVDLARDRSAQLWRGRIVAVVTFAIVWTGVEILKQYSTPNGPGTTFAMAQVPAALTLLAGTTCVDASTMARDAWVTLSELVPIVFGLRTYPVGPAQAIDVRILWLPLVAVLAAASIRGVWRGRRNGPTSVTWFGAYLVLIGLQAIVAYALTRCGHPSAFNLRYMELSLLLPVGAIALGLGGESRTSVRVPLMAVAALWAAVSAVNNVAHARVLSQAPERSARVLVRYLDAHDIRFIDTDYWTGYYVAFVSDERIVARTDLNRIQGYPLVVDAHPSRTATVARRHNPNCASEVEVAGYFVCAPRAAALQK